MVDSIPPKPKEEKYPLIMVAGAGDTGENQAPNTGPNGPPPIAAFSTIWSGPPLRRLPRFRNSWRDHWPEYLSACWMTFVLLGISFLIFYIAGLVIYRQQTFVVLKCNNTTDTSMFYHKIVDGHVHFSYYSEFLSIQAMKYPNVRHFIYFLFDDTNHDRLRRTLYGKGVPNKGNVINTREIKMFQRRFRNANITAVSLSKFFAKSPMKNVWMYIPSMYLAFYARLHSVWENGGIAIDLDSYNSNYEVNDKNLEYYIKDYHKKAKKIQHQEKEKSNALNYYMGNGAIYVSYTLVRMNGDDYPNIINNMTARQENSTEVVQKISNLPNATTINETKTTIFANEIADNSSIVESNNAFKQLNVTIKNDGEKMIKLFSNSYPVENISNKTADNNSQELNKYDNESNVTANNTNDENIDTLPNPIEIMVMTGDTMNIGRFEDIFSQPDTFSQQLEISVSGQNREEPYFGIQSKSTALPVLTMDSSGIFIAAAAPHHKLLEGLMNCKCRWLRPKYLIQNIMNHRCSPEMYDHEICPNTFIY